MSASKIKGALKATVLIAVVAAVGVLGFRARADASELSRITAKAKSAGLPVTQVDFDAVVGPEPNTEDRQRFKELIDAAIDTGVFRREAPLMEPVWQNQRASACEPFMTAAETVAALDRSAQDLEERTAWALRLDREKKVLEQQLGLVRMSRWVKLGRRVGLGPAV